MPTKVKTRDDYHARLVITGLSGMNRKTLKRLVMWLRNQADSYEKDSSGYSKRFVARLMK